MSLKKPTLSETVKELERKLKSSTEENAILKKEIMQRDLKIKALCNDLRRYVEKETTQFPVANKKNTSYPPQKRIKHWGEFD
jgi:hypothetical protein